MNPVAAVHLLAAIVIVAVSVPLIRKKVKMNRWYGVRILSAAERDGGAHVDAKLDKYYEVLCGGEYGIGITYRLLGDFADRLSTWKERPLERIWNPTVLAQGRMATVWAPYDFHREGKFSHSGIDVFTLMRRGDEWKIVNLAFNTQPHVPSQHPAGPPRS